MQVTIVGMGHYAKDLISFKYRDEKLCDVKAVIAPGKSEEDSKGTGLDSVPVIDSIDAWIDTYGRPGDKDVFDLCVFQDSLVQLVGSLKKAGARNIILPKPVAMDSKSLATLLKLSRGLNVLVASQWHYSKVIDEIASRLDGEGHLEVMIEMRQDLRPNSKYDVYNALLPHCLQIASELGGIGKLAEARAEDTGISIRYGRSGKIDGLAIATDTASSERVRTITVKQQGKELLRADIDAAFKEGKGIRVPTILHGGTSTRVEDDSLAQMVHQEMKHFLGKGHALTLRNYVPVNDQLIKILKERA